MKRRELVQRASLPRYSLNEEQLTGKSPLKSEVSGEFARSLLQPPPEFGGILLPVPGGQHFDFAMLCVDLEFSSTMTLNVISWREDVR